jgi:CBS domain-containing protein
MWPLESVPVIDADRDLAEALPELAQHPLHRALVLVDGRPKGLLSITDAARVMEVLAAARGATALGRRSPTPVAPRRRHPVLGA